VFAGVRKPEAGDFGGWGMARWSAGVERVVIESSAVKDWDIALELCGMEGFVDDILARDFCGFYV
jgi:hypothetical protein